MVCPARPGAPGKTVRVEFRSLVHVLEAASHGLGFALESTLLATKYLASGSLVEVAPEALSTPVAAHHLVCPKAQSSFPRVRRFLEWIESELVHGFAY
ncbi:LysR substrate-binding domain-containing protein [Pseudomonas kitaguniensis]|uniref:LysR substrate-binding domain-containing protein n=1 Tax=Pseudomonas kitaguniensis TaxID=2607908 RepID=UPI00240D434B|nr:LysR substrate-binding domain-containing protein [Pseudomonas kitaguniensis]